MLTLVQRAREQIDMPRPIRTSRRPKALALASVDDAQVLEQLFVVATKPEEDSCRI